MGALLLLSAIWGYNWVVMKEALRFSGPFEFAALRTVLGAASLFLILLWQRKPLAPRELPLTALLGLLQSTGFVGFTVWALQSGGAGKTAVLVYTMPFWVLMLAWPLLGERLRGLEWLAVALAALGLVFVLEPWRPQGSSLSKVLAILAGLWWGLSVILAKIMRRRVEFDLISLTAWQMLLGGIPLVLVAGVVPEMPIQWSGTFIAALLFSIFLSSALAWMLWLYIVHQMSAGVAGLSTLAIPVIGVLAAWLQLGERPGLAETAGMFLIGAALAVLAGRSIRKPAPVEPEMAQE